MTAEAPQQTHARRRAGPLGGFGVRAADAVGGRLSVGAWVIVAIALASSVAVIAWPEPRREGLAFWIFARSHQTLYEPILDDYNATDPPEPVQVFLLDGSALQRRMLSAFMSGTPVAELIEVEQGVIGQVFSGPLDTIGFVDLTDRLKESGIYDAFVEPSFSQWTTRGRIFGIPHDVHPVGLAYRADLLGELDPDEFATWDDFAEKLRHHQDTDGDGEADRYLLNLWFTDVQAVEALLMQAGGGFFDGGDQLAIDREVNARVTATVISWMIGPGRIAIDAPNSAAGNLLRLEGRVMGQLMPDWMAGIYEQDLPQLSGKWRILPVPAWEPGGRRTTVQGGTMLGITRQTLERGDFDAAWAAAETLYLSPELAENLFETTKIISPVKALWDEPYYHEPQPYFGGQRVGTLFIELAPDVPRRSSNPFRNLARQEYGRALSRLYQHADAHAAYTVEELLPAARSLLAETQAEVRRRMDRNVFVRQEMGEGGS